MEIVNVRLRNNDWDEWDDPSDLNSFFDVVRHRSARLKKFCAERKKQGPCLIRLHIFDGEFKPLPISMSFTVDQVVVISRKTGEIVKWLKDRTGVNV